MYPCFTWELVMDALRFVEHLLGTTDLAHSLVTVLSAFFRRPVAMIVDLYYESVFQIKSEIIHNRGLYFHSADCSVKEYDEWVVFLFQFVYIQIIVFRSVTPYIFTGEHKHFR
jgi:hypothetical protein